MTCNAASFDDKIRRKFQKAVFASKRGG
jgi:hypothetical protein